MVTNFAWFAALLVVAVGAPESAPSVPEPVNILSLQEGTLPVVIPPFYGSWVAEYLLDESPASGWACESGQINNNVFVFELDSEVFMQCLVNCYSVKPVFAVVFGIILIVIIQRMVK